MCCMWNGSWPTAALGHACSLLFPRPSDLDHLLHLGNPVPVVDVRGCGTLGERVVTGIGEVVAVSISTAAMRKGF